MRKSFMLLFDSETSLDGQVVDFGAVLVDRRGAVYAHCAVLVHGVYTDRDNHPLFYNEQSNFSKENLPARYNAYENMLASGSRMLATRQAINVWLGRCAAMYQPIATAYNIAFDRKACIQTGIDLTMFPKQFCLMQAAQTAFAKTKAYRRMILKNHLFRPPTDYGNMCYRTDAETMAKFCLGQDNLEDEPHTALEDAMYYELPILIKLMRAKSNKWLLSEPRKHHWREFQVKDNFKPS